jgi:hypothetical protein
MFVWEETHNIGEQIHDTLRNQSSELPEFQSQRVRT